MSRRGRYVKARQLLFKLGIFSAVLISSGCMVGPHYVRPPAQVAEQWMDVSEAQLKPEPADNAEWWTIFNDPGLNSLVTQAYAQNLSLQQAGLRILQARARLGIAVGDFYPQVQEATGSYTRSYTSINVAGLNDISRLSFVDLDRGSNNFMTGFDTGWELDFWGNFGATLPPRVPRSWPRLPAMMMFWYRWWRRWRRPISSCAPSKNVCAWPGTMSTFNPAASRSPMSGFVKDTCTFLGKRVGDDKMCRELCFGLNLQSCRLLRLTYLAACASHSIMP